MSGLPPELDACEDCLRRSWLVSRLSANLDRVRARIEEVLALPDRELLLAVAGHDAMVVDGELERWRPGEGLDRLERASLAAVCACSPAYPARLRELESRPAVLYVNSEQPAHEVVATEGAALVGTRRASQYGCEVAASLGRGLAASGIAVVSGMAFGIDAAAHRGALSAAGGRTVAVLPAGAERAQPRAHVRLLEQIRERGAAVSELPPGTPARRWTFTARNRLIAALATITVVVEAGRYSGSIVTARAAARLGRAVGAVPGRVGSPLTDGTHELLRAGAVLVRDAHDVLDALAGAASEEGTLLERLDAAGRLQHGSAGSARDRSVAVRQKDRARSAGARPTPTAPLTAEADRLDRELRRCGDVKGAIAKVGLGAGAALAVLAELELAGLVRRGPGGSYEPRV